MRLWYLKFQVASLDFVETQANGESKSPDSSLTFRRDSGKSKKWGSTILDDFPELLFRKVFVFIH